MLKSPWFRLRTNFPRWSVAMNSTLTSLTRALMVRTGSVESVPVEGEASGRAMLEAATYGVCARANNPAMASPTAITTSHRHHVVYFMPVQPKNFTPNTAKAFVSQLDARIGPKAAATVLTVGEWRGQAKLQ